MEAQCLRNLPDEYTGTDNLVQDKIANGIGQLYVLADVQGS